MFRFISLLPLLFSAAYSDGFGIFAEGPTTVNYGIFYSGGMFTLKNGYSYSNTGSEAKNDSITTNKTNSFSFATELSPGLVFKTSLLNIELCPAYRLTFTNAQTDFYTGTIETTKTNSLSNALKFNLIFSKEFGNRLRLGVGSTLVNYAFASNESKVDYQQDIIKDTDSKTNSNSLTHGLSFFVAVSAELF